MKYQRELIRFVQTRVFRVRLIFIQFLELSQVPHSLFYSKKIFIVGEIFMWQGVQNYQFPCEQHRVNFCVGLQWLSFVANIGLLWKIKILQELLQVFYFCFKLISEYPFLFKNNFFKKHHLLEKKKKRI